MRPLLAHSVDARQACRRARTVRQQTVADVGIVLVLVAAAAAAAVVVAAVERRRSSAARCRALFVYCGRWRLLRATTTTVLR